MGKSKCDGCKFLYRGTINGGNRMLRFCRKYPKWHNVILTASEAYKAFCLGDSKELNNLKN